MKSFALILGCLLLSSLAHAGKESSGGGDEYALDFAKTSTQIIYPWLVANGSKLQPAVDANAFLMALNPQNIVSQDHVFESCDGSNQGREVEACYNSENGQIVLSRSRYPVASHLPSKVGLVAHEAFRKMNLEGDGYEVTRQIPIAQLKSEVMSGNGGADSKAENQDGSVTFFKPFAIIGDAKFAFGRQSSNAIWLTNDPDGDARYYRRIRQAQASGVCRFLGFSEATSYGFGDQVEQDGIQFAELDENGHVIGVATKTKNKGGLSFLNLFGATKFEVRYFAAVTCR